MQNYGFGGAEHAEHVQIWHPEDGECACACGMTFYASLDADEDDLDMDDKDEKASA